MSQTERLRAQIVSAIRDIADASGGVPPGRLAFTRETGIKESAWRGVLWARWNDAVKEAGLEPNSKVTAIKEDVLLQRLAEAIRHYGKLPTYSEIRLYGKTHPGFPTDNTFQVRYSTKEKLAARVREWAVAKPEFGDLLQFIPQETKVVGATAETASREGFVYLLRSGTNYKIGRSDEVERRVKEITLALPDAVEMTHVIRTDDPPGIEAYWHRRFSERRANGEWFKLTRADVAAFKRRKFQ